MLRVLAHQGRVVRPQAPYAEHKSDSVPGSTSVAIGTVNFRTRSQRVRRSMYDMSDVLAIGCVHRLEGCGGRRAW